LKIFQNKLLLIGVVCTAPLVLGTLAYFYRWTPGEGGSYGELIAPRPLFGPPIERLRGKWLLVAFDAAACDAYCERKLYFMRQVRRAQGLDMERVERIWVLTDAGAPRRELLQAIEGTQLSYPKDASSFMQSFPGNPADHIYVVDPLGNLMMRYPRDPDPSKMLKDLQRLLKYSRTG